MKKIVLIVPSLNMGGMERVLVNYANLFARNSYDVTVLNLTGDDPAIVGDFHKSIRYERCYVPVPHITRAKFKDILRFHFRVLPWRKWIQFHSAKYLQKKYIKGRYDVQIGFCGSPSIKIVSGCKDKTVQTIGWIHGVNIYNDVPSAGGIKKAKKLYESINKLICVSEKAKENVESVFNVKKAYVLHNPNDRETILRKAADLDVPEKKKFTMITVARIDELSKRFSRMLNVVKRLNADGFNFDYWIVGDGIDYQTVVQQAKNDGLDNVTFFGQQENPYKYMQQADLYVAASAYEAFSMVMMEAIILAKPMLSTEVSGAAEMLGGGEYGMIVENSEEGLYQGLKKILEDRVLFEHYVQKAEERKNYLSEGEIMERLGTILADGAEV